MGNLKVSRAETETHSSLRLCKHLQDSLRTTYRALKLEHPEMGKGLALSCPVKAVNDTLEPGGIFSPALVFGAFFELSRISGPCSSRSALIERANAASTARQEMKKIMSRMKLNRALRLAFPPACNRSHQPGHIFLIMEGENGLKQNRRMVGSIYDWIRRLWQKTSLRSRL